MTDLTRNKRAKPDPELLKLPDSLLANYHQPEDLIGENGLLKQLTKMLVERALAAPIPATATVPRRSRASSTRRH